MKFNELINEWLYENHQSKIKERTLLRYESVIRNYLIPYFGSREIESLTPRDIQGWMNEIRTKKSERTRQPLSLSSVNMILAIIKLAFDYAVDYEIIKNNPAVRIKRQRVTRNGEIAKAFTKQEQIKIERYVEQINNDDNFFIILVLYTGIRLGELVALTWNDINLKSGTIVVNKTVYKTKTKSGKWKYKVSEPKTMASVREIPLSSFLIEKLKIMKKGSNSENFLCRKNGKIISYTAVIFKFQHILKKINVRKLSFHSLRHTFATRALENNMDIKTLSEILGHSNVSTTLNIYVHSLMEHKKNQIKKIKRLI